MTSKCTIDARSQLSTKGRLALTAMILAFSTEVVDMVWTNLGQPREFWLRLTLTSIGYLLFHGLAIYGLWHRSGWGKVLAWLISIISIIVGVALLVAPYVLGPINLNGIPIEQPIPLQLLGWTKVTIYAACVFFLLRDWLVTKSERI